jgi:hypothetical protein
MDSGLAMAFFHNHTIVSDHVVTFHASVCRPYGPLYTEIQGNEFQKGSREAWNKNAAEQHGHAVFLSAEHSNTFRLSAKVIAHEIPVFMLQDRHTATPLI